MGPQKHIDYCGTIHSGIEALKVPFQVKLTKIPLVNPRLIESQIGSKSSKNNIFHTSISNPSYSVIFVNFDPRLTFKGTKNPNYDSTTRTGQNQCHCEDYQIPFPTTIHGLKSELKWLRYPENCKKCISTLPNTITFDSTIGFSIPLFFYKLDIQNFPRTPRLESLQICI